MKICQNVDTTCLEETRVISESKDSAGLNDMGGGVATGSNCTLWFDSAEFFLLLIWQPESGVLESLGMAVSLVTDGGLLLILLLLFVIFLLFGSTKCVETWKEKVKQNWFFPPK